MWHGQIQAVGDGDYPLLGIMHYEQDGAPAFVFDLMEPERPKVDRAVLAFLRTEALRPADFTIRADGVVRLNPELPGHCDDVVFEPHSEMIQGR